jgi:hypothetical protein
LECPNQAIDLDSISYNENYTSIVYISEPGIYRFSYKWGTRGKLSGIADNGFNSFFDGIML